MEPELLMHASQERGLGVATDLNSHLPACCIQPLTITDVLEGQCCSRGCLPWRGQSRGEKAQQGGQEGGGRRAGP